MANSKGELSRAVGEILGAHVIELDERQRIIDALEPDDVEIWNDLPPDIRLLLAEIKTRPGPGVV